MRIGIDIRLIGKKRTGDEAVIFNLVKNLARIDGKNDYVLFTDIQAQEKLLDVTKKLEIAGKENFKIVSLPAQNRFAWNFWTLPMYLRKNPVDVYHTQYITPWFVPKKIKIVTIVHDISFNFFPQFIKFSDLFFLKTLIPLSLHRADKVIGVSQFTREEIIRFYKIAPAKVEFIYNSVDDEFLTEDISPEKIIEVRDKYSLPGKFILYIGTLQPRKNIPHLIEAFARIKSRLDGTVLVIAGNPQAHNFDKMIYKEVVKNNLENDVHFPGFIDEQDKKAIFRMAHAFVFPSLYEGFGIPLLEAMSQKVPVLASDIPSLKEIGQNGASYFDKLSTEDFAEKLQDICMNDGLRSELIRSGSQRVSFFSWENSARKMLAIYEKL
jgi:glycosyltransferase involved in cell wall biosynthesis